MEGWHHCPLRHSNGRLAAVPQAHVAAAGLPMAQPGTICLCMCLMVMAWANPADIETVNSTTANVFNIFSLPLPVKQGRKFYCCASEPKMNDELKKSRRAPRRARRQKSKPNVKWGALPAISSSGRHPEPANAEVVEGVGFEPTREQSPLPVFKTGALNHSATLPALKHHHESSARERTLQQPMGLWT
jgi:hypothetical protein